MKARLILCGLFVAGLLLSAAPAPTFQSPVLTPTPTSAVGERVGDYGVGLDAGEVAVVWCNSNLDLLVHDRFPGGLRVTCVGLVYRVYLPTIAGGEPEPTATPRPTRTPTPIPPVDTAGPPTHTSTTK